MERCAAWLNKGYDGSPLAQVPGDLHRPTEPSCTLPVRYCCYCHCCHRSCYCHSRQPTEEKAAGNQKLRSGSSMSRLLCRPLWQQGARTQSFGSDRQELRYASRVTVCKPQRTCPVRRCASGLT